MWYVFGLVRRRMVRKFRLDLVGPLLIYAVNAESCLRTSVTVRVNNVISLRCQALPCLEDKYPSSL